MNRKHSIAVQLKKTSVFAIKTCFLKYNLRFRFRRALLLVILITFEMKLFWNHVKNKGVIGGKVI